uniref:Epiphycan n=1 Tax=Poecilia latipinna TaxID=48699 RepID=A0A3B3U404_9TELE
QMSPKLLMKVSTIPSQILTGSFNRSNEKHQIYCDWRCSTHKVWFYCSICKCLRLCKCWASGHFRLRGEGLPVCLLCTCLGGSVYCDDLKLNRVPPLPKDTTHFYARYNRITKISKSDFANMNKLKKIDLTANKITSIEDRTFMGLPELEEVIIRENHISQLPALPETMTLIDASHNNIGSKGIHKEAFKDMTSLLYLYLTDNDVDYIPVPLPDSLRSLHLQRNNIQMMHEDTFCNLNDFNYIRNALEDIRLDGNPINLSKTPQAYICLPRIPIGNLI